MSNISMRESAGTIGENRGVPWARLVKSVGLILGCGALLMMAGCKSSGDGPKYDSTPAAHQGMAPDEQKAMAEATKASHGTNAPSDSIVLREGDTVRIAFPGAPNLNTVQAIRRDGKLSLQLVGEVQAAGKTPVTLEKDLVELYGPQLQLKEVTVALESSAFSIYVTGAVLRPGKYASDHPISALEAIMEAGGFDYSRANLKTVRVIRNVDGRTEHFQLNMKDVISGKRNDNFKLSPSDIIYVPERFTWF